ncbi:MAG: IS630 family transposase [Planctomycetia bacterium]
MIDETGLFLNPLVRRTWAPIGRTPTIRWDGGHRRKVSVIGAVTASPGTRRLGFQFATIVDGDFKAEQVVEFLKELLRRLPGKVVVIWDGGGNQKGPVVRAFLAATPRLRLERLPAYCPELNPVEAVWSWLKWGRLANYAADDLEHLNDWILEHPTDLKRRPTLIRKLWNRSDLPFPTTPTAQSQIPANQ